MSPKNKRSEVLGEGGVEQEPPKLAVEMRLEELNDIFKDLVSAVEEMIEPREGEKKRELTTEEEATLAGIVGPMFSAPERIDQFVALIRNYEHREAILRMAVAGAEGKARKIGAFVKSVKDSAELYMLERGIKKIEGFANTLQLNKKPDSLNIGNEEFIPDQYFNRNMTFRIPMDADVEEMKERAAELGLEFQSAERVLNTELLVADLNKTETVEVDGEKKQKFKEVAGAEIIRDGRRLSIR